MSILQRRSNEYGKFFRGWFSFKLLGVVVSWELWPPSCMKRGLDFLRGCDNVTISAHDEEKL